LLKNRVFFSRYSRAAMACLRLDFLRCLRGA